MGLIHLFNIKKKIRNHLDLISIHIPKTGGRSLYEILKFVYGDKLDLRTKREDYFPSDQHNIGSFEVSKDISVIHGHFHYKEIKNKISRDTKLITWFREPADRVISNYYFLMYRISVGKIQPDQMDKAGFSLLEYAQLKSERNVMCKFLDGSVIDDFYFIGDFHNYYEEVRLLGSLLNWPENLPDVYENKTEALKIFNFCTTRPSDITNDMREEIIKLNNNDYILYNQSKELRNSRNF